VTDNRAEGLLSSDSSEIIVKKECLKIAAEGKTRRRWSVCPSQDSAERNRGQRGIGSCYDLTAPHIEEETIFRTWDIRRCMYMYISIISVPITQSTGSGFCFCLRVWRTGRGSSVPVE